MSEATELRSFVLEALADLGAVVSTSDGLEWIQAPEALQRSLEVPAHFALTFEPGRAGEFEAELVVPGSYFLEKLLALATRRGRWDAVRFPASGPEWISIALAESGLETADGVGTAVQEVQEELLVLFTFRVTLVSDEKRESFHRIVVSQGDRSTWPVDWSLADQEMGPSPAAVPPDLEASYRAATATLRELTREDMARFRTRSLGLLEEEVGRIFGYFDTTMTQMREADAEGSQDLLHAVAAERDRRLTEALERFDPKAGASLCAIRAVSVPTARVRLTVPDGTTADVKVDAWSHCVRGLNCSVCGTTEGPWRPSPAQGLQCARCAATPTDSARLPRRLRSDTLRRGRRAGRDSAQSSRGSKGRLRAASEAHRGP